MQRNNSDFRIKYNNSLGIFKKPPLEIDLKNGPLYVLKHYFPMIEAWRPFIDGDRQRYDYLHESSFMDTKESILSFKQKRGWLTWDKNYLKGMCVAFAEMLKHLKKGGELTLPFVKRMHFLTMNGVANTNYDTEKNQKIGVFRECKEVGYLIEAERCPLGMKELKENSRNRPYMTLRGYIDFKTEEKSIYYVSSITPKEDQKISEALDGYFNQFIEEYKKELDAVKNKRDLQLRVIVIFIREISQLHPFLDGNGRTFSMIILNFLLMQNGFLFACLPDPAAFGNMDIATLTRSVKKGMKNTLKFFET